MLAKPTLLIAENDVSLLELLARNFFRQGYDVTPVCHPRQALAAASIDEFDVALIDGRLPEHDGVWLMQELRKYQTDLQTIVLSAHCDEEFEQRCLDNGAFAYLRKPCELAELESSVEAAVEQRAQEGPAAATPNESRAESRDVAAAT